MQWIEASNQCGDYDRNYTTAVCQPWPRVGRHTVQTLARATSLSEETADLTDELALLDFERADISPRQMSIPITLLENLSQARQKNLLRYWLRANPAAYMPSVSQLEVLLNQALNAEQQAAAINRLRRNPNQAL